MARATSLLAMIMLVLASGGAAAQPVADFYRGKQIRFVIGFSPGAGFDLYARLAARFLPNHIPGNPAMLVQNMSGAGSLTALHYVTERAPKDGTVIGMVVPTLTTDPLFFPDKAKFDPTRFAWIGSMTSDTPTCGFWNQEKLGLQELKTKSFVIGATSATGSTVAAAKVIAHVLRLNFKIVPGYSDILRMAHAAEKSEIDGFCGLQKSVLKSNLWSAYQSGTVRVPIQVALRADPELVGVPNAFDLVQSEEDKQILLLLAGPWHFGRPLLASEAAPADRLTALRQAFVATMRDPDFLNEAQKLNFDINPITGEEIVETIRRLYAIPQPVLERANPLFGGE